MFTILQVKLFGQDQKEAMLNIGRYLMLFGTFILFIVLCSPKDRSANNYPEEKIYLHSFFAEEDTSKMNLLYQPETVRIDSDGNIFVLDAGNNRIMKYNINSNFLQQIGSVGQGPGELLRPIDFDIGADGKLCVVDEGNHRVSIFDKGGKFQNSFPVSTFPRVNSLVNKRGQILLNQPEMDGGLLDVYDYEGNKLRSIGVVEPFEHPYIKGPNRMATWAYNRVRAKQNHRGEIDVYYIARPLFRRFSEQGNLLLEKEIKGSEIDTARVYEKRNQKHQQTNANSITTTTFIDDFDYLGREFMIIRLIGVVDSFYVIDWNGNVVKKFKVKQGSDVKVVDPLVARFAYNTVSNQLIGSDVYDGFLFRIELEGH